MSTQYTLLKGMTAIESSSNFVIIMNGLTPLPYGSSKARLELTGEELVKLAQRMLEVASYSVDPKVLREALEGITAQMSDYIED